MAPYPSPTGSSTANSEGLDHAHRHLAGPPGPRRAGGLSLRRGLQARDAGQHGPHRVWGRAVPHDPAPEPKRGLSMPADQFSPGIDTGPTTTSARTTSPATPTPNVAPAGSSTNSPPSDTPSPRRRQPHDLTMFHLRSPEAPLESLLTSMLAPLWLPTTRVDRVSHCGGGMLLGGPATPPLNRAAHGPSDPPRVVTTGHNRILARQGQCARTNHRARPGHRGGRHSAAGFEWLATGPMIAGCTTSGGLAVACGPPSEVVVEAGCGVEVAPFPLPVDDVGFREAPQQNVDVAHGFRRLPAELPGE